MTLPFQTAAQINLFDLTREEIMEMEEVLCRISPFGVKCLKNQDQLLTRGHDREAVLLIDKEKRSA